MPGKNSIRKSIKRNAATEKRSQRIIALPKTSKYSASEIAAYPSPPVSQTGSVEALVNDASSPFPPSQLAVSVAIEECHFNWSAAVKVKRERSKSCDVAFGCYPDLCVKVPAAVDKNDQSFWKSRLVLMKRPKSASLDEAIVDDVSIPFKLNPHAIEFPPRCAEEREIAICAIEAVVLEPSAKVNPDSQTIVMATSPAVEELRRDAIVGEAAPAIKELKHDTIVVESAPAAKEFKQTPWWMQVPSDESVDSDSYHTSLTLELTEQFPHFFKSPRFMEWQARQNEIIEAYMPLKKREELWVCGRGPRPLARDYQRIRRLIDGHRIIDADMYDIEKELVKKGY